MPKKVSFEDLKQKVKVLEKEINHLKEEKAVLKGKESFLDQVIDQSPYPTWISDISGTLLHANPALKKFLNLSDEQLVGKYNVLKDPLIEQQGLIPVIKTVYEQGKPIHFFCDWDGNDIPDLGLAGSNSVSIEATMFPIFDAKGRLTNVVLTWIDISEKNRADKKSKAYEAKCRAMMDTMADPVFICSSSCEIEFMNRAMIDRVGCNSIGEKCHRALHGLKQQCDWCNLDKILEGKTDEFDVVSPFDNRTFHKTDMPIYNEDGTISKMTIYRDITDLLEAISEKEKIQEQLFQTQKLQTIGTLAGGIAHDFNNILFPVIGLTEMLLEKEMPERVNEDLEIILKAGKRARDLVSQILAFSRQGQNKLELFQLHSIVKEIIKIARSTLPSNIKIKQDIEADTGLVMVDLNKFHQAVMNLITNAFHAMRNTGGVLFISLGKDKRKQQNDDEQKIVSLKITDTGVGMDKATQKRIFEPYFSKKTKDRGSGMGLAVTHGIVSSFGGRIEVESEPGKGSSFTIELPVAKTEQESAPIIDTKENSPVQGRILIVDDEKSVTLILKRILEKKGFSTHVFNDSIKALDAFAKKPDSFDLVISDLMMPVMTGDQFCLKVSGIRPGIPIILLTGNCEGVIMGEKDQLGIHLIMTKPLEKSEILSAVNGLIK